MKLTLKPLPYDYRALEPHISAATLETHYDKHHRTYVDKTNKGIEGGPLAGKPLLDIVLNATGDLFNNAAQVWNHDFYWRSMSPEGGGSPPAQLAEALTMRFGSVEAFKREFATAAANEFGSGWAWLIKSREGDLKIVATTDAENPVTSGHTPLITIDVWEHAYYLDYRNERPKYVKAYLEHLINWEFAARNLGV
jgi:superoxide dismutase, Fe-Mn family